MTSQAGTQIVQILGRNIALARGIAQLSQRQVAQELDMDARAVSRWETGRVMPSPTSLAALAKLFDREIAWFYMVHDEAVAA